MSKKGFSHERPPVNAAYCSLDKRQENRSYNCFQICCDSPDAVVATRRTPKSVVFSQAIEAPLAVKEMLQQSGCSRISGKKTTLWVVPGFGPGSGLFCPT